jgi:hypothetical protein
LQPPIRHDPIVIEPHDQKAKAVDGHCDAGTHPHKGGTAVSINVHPS